MTRGFRILEHPADVGIEGFGGTLREAFEESAMGLMSIILDPESVEETENKHLHLTATDHDHLLVQWLTEILYLYDGQQFAAKRFMIQELHETSLVATAFGEPVALSKHRTRMDVKAVTYHQLQIEETPSGARVRVFLDI